MGVMTGTFDRTSADGTSLNVGMQPAQYAEWAVRVRVVWCGMPYPLFGMTEEHEDMVGGTAGMRVWYGIDTPAMRG